MKTVHNIFWEFKCIAYEYGMFDNLTQAEIEELAAISEDRTFCTLQKRYEDLRKIYYSASKPKKPFYQVMRPTIVMIATYLQRWLATCCNLRVRAIVGGYLRTMLDKIEYHSNIYQWRFVNLIKAYPNMSDAELAKYCIANKIIITDNPEKNSDINWLEEVMQDTRKYMNGPSAAGTYPITARERIFAARWLEIFERL